MSVDSTIQRTPGVCGGDACIRRTRISVWLLVEERRQGRSEANILDAHPNLTGDDLAAAWADAADHREEIDRAIRENEVGIAERNGVVSQELLRRGRHLGLSDEEIRLAFDPPLSPEELQRGLALVGKD
jgi:uncharacterized protein (DUF433 family)